MAKQKLMSFDEWEQEYKPIKNIFEEDAPYDGLMHKTFGKEEELVRKSDATKIWTLIDTDGDTQIDSGYARVNRMGYFLTEKAAPADQFISVIDEPKDYLRMMKKEGYFSGDPRNVFELSAEMEAAWESIKPKAKKPK